MHLFLPQGGAGATAQRAGGAGQAGGGPAAAGGLLRQLRLRPPGDVGCRQGVELALCATETRTPRSRRRRRQRPAGAVALAFACCTGLLNALKTFFF